MWIAEGIIKRKKKKEWNKLKNKEGKKKTNEYNKGINKKRLVKASMKEADDDPFYENWNEHGKMWKLSSFCSKYFLCTIISNEICSFMISFKKTKLKEQKDENEIKRYTQRKKEANNNLY